MGEAPIAIAEDTYISPLSNFKCWAAEWCYYIFTDKCYYISVNEWVNLIELGFKVLHCFLSATSVISPSTGPTYPTIEFRFDAVRRFPCELVVSLFFFKAYCTMWTVEVLKLVVWLLLALLWASLLFCYSWKLMSLGFKILAKFWAPAIYNGLLGIRPGWFGWWKLTIYPFTFL